MSKDICLFVERKFFRYDDLKKKNGVWVSIDKWSQEPDFYLYREDNNIVLWKVFEEDRMYDISNRKLFAILCNYDNKNNVKYISDPRGIPEDVSSIVRDYYSYCLPDVYNSSWLLLSELLDYQWNDCELNDSLFVKEFLNKLQKIDKPENIRIIFWIN